MSDDLNQQAIALMKAQRFADALTLLRTQIERNPHWSSLYMAGQCCRYLGDLDNAVIYLRRAISLEAAEPAVFLALGIALQLTNRLIDAIEAFRRAIEINPDYELAYNSLALTQKKQGELDLALHSYEAGAHALSRRIVKNFRNVRSNKIFKHKNCEYHLWMEHAMYAGMYLCSLDDRIQGMAWPTGKQAEEEEATEKHEGLYWVDRPDSEKKSTRLFLPNYFNTFRETLRLDRAYSDLIGNRGTVLEQMGRYDEARKHFDEASFFSHKF
jgi:tetratricopeptide (TPR) repeat protein